MGNHASLVLFRECFANRNWTLNLLEGRRGTFLFFCLECLQKALQYGILECALFLLFFSLIARCFVLTARDHSDGHVQIFEEGFAHVVHCGLHGIDLGLDRVIFLFLIFFFHLSNVYCAAFSFFDHGLLS